MDTLANQNHRFRWTISQGKEAWWEVKSQCKDKWTVKVNVTALPSSSTPRHNACTTMFTPNLRKSIPKTDYYSINLKMIGVGNLINCYNQDLMHRGKCQWARQVIVNQWYHSSSRWCSSDRQWINSSRSRLLHLPSSKLLFLTSNYRLWLRELLQILNWAEQVEATELRWD